MLPLPLINEAYMERTKIKNNFADFFEIIYKQYTAWHIWKSSN